MKSQNVLVAKTKIENFEPYVYRNYATKLYNQTFGMLTLNNWLRDKKRFVLIFADLDRLKYVNYEFGHSEGDAYIMNAAKHLKEFSPDAVVCRIGGDKFMLLVPDVSYEKAHFRMITIYYALQNDGYLKGKKYSYSISFGIVAVETGDKMSANEILAIADERMYEDKRMKKKIKLESIDLHGEDISERTRIPFADEIEINRMIISELLANYDGIPATI